MDIGEAFMSLVPQCIRLIGDHDFDRHGLPIARILFKTCQRLLRIFAQQYRMWSGCQTVL
jgi:hypothetical protein